MTAVNLQQACKSTLTKPHDETNLEPSSSNHSFPHINEGIGSLWASEKCNKKPFCECSHLWNFKRTSCKQDWGEQILSHSSNTPLPPRIRLSSLFSSVFPFFALLSALDFKLAFSLFNFSLCLCHCCSVLSIFFFHNLSLQHLADVNVPLFFFPKSDLLSLRCWFNFRFPNWRNYCKFIWLFRIKMINYKR